MKSNLYPLSIAAVVLGIFSMYFGGFYVVVHLLSSTSPSRMIVDPISYNSPEALIGGVTLVLLLAAFSGLVLSVTLPLYLGHLSQEEELKHTKPTVEVEEVERELVAA